MKTHLLLTFFIVVFGSQVWAQHTVTGLITSAEDNLPLIGASVLVVGNSTGTVTDIEGQYSIDIDDPETAILQISYTGYETKEIAVSNRTVIDIIMAAGVALDEVVVTALGIERNKKAMSYSVSEVDGEGFQEARELNVANALAGKVAGVNVANIASGPAGSSRVIIRGNVSLQGNNQPLYVVDGVPIDNSGFGQAGLWGGSDEGDGISSINPDDIASMTVLKGANAAALYGSRASNGVILITTKSGKARTGLGIDFNTNLVFENFNNLYDFQDQYGQGNEGRIPSDATEAWNVGTANWGGRLNGSSVPQFDGVSRPYTYQSDSNLDKFFQTGTTWTNTLGLYGGNEDHHARMNVSHLKNSGIIPDGGFDRINLSLSYTGNFGKFLEVSSKVMYSNEQALNRPNLADSPGNAVQGLIRLPTNYDVNDLIGDPDKPGAVPEGFVPQDGKAPGEEMQISSDLWNQNPWWAANQYDNTDTRDRIITSNTAKFNITDFLFVQGRFGMDWFTRRDRGLTPYGTGYQRTGSLSERENRVREINIEGIIGFDKTFGDFSVNVIGGGNYMRRSWEQLNLSGNTFNIPFFHTFANLANQTPSYGYNEKGINSLYGSATFGFKDFFYLTGTVRNDWFSTLNPDNNQILYPSNGASLILTDMLNVSSTSFVTFAKLRGSWAQVGGDTDPYKLDLTYSLGQGHLNQTTASISQVNIPNRSLVPLTSTEYEIGLDVRFFNNRLGLDFTYYNQRTTDDILDAAISTASGFEGTTINVGEMRNSGIEMLLTAAPIRTADFTWDISFNFSVNNNEVVSLSQGIDQFQTGEPRTRWAFTNNIVGQPFSTITGFSQEMINGQPVFNPDNGQPIQSSETSILGNGVHKYVGGVMNTLGFKGFYLDFLIDFKSGGDIYTGTNVRFVGQGIHQMTVNPTSGLGFESDGRESITVTGVDPEGNPFTKTLDETEVPGFWGAYSQLSDRFVEDASFVKLRQLSLGYSLPPRLLANTPFQAVRLSVVGRNLLLLHSNLDNVDPESTYTSDNGQGLDYYGLPQTRTIGFNLKLSF